MTDLIGGLPGPLETAFYFFAALFPLVLVHELGHFALAKLNKVRVDEFGIGFPPKVLVLAKIGDTEYTVNALPLGGFVRMAGEDDPDIPDSFASKSKSARVAILLAGPFANFLFAALIFAGMAIMGLIPEPVLGVDGVKISRVTPDTPAAAAGLLPGDIVIATNGEALVAAGSSAEPIERIAGAVDELVTRTDASTGEPMELTLLRGELVRLGDEVDLADDEIVLAKTTLPAVAGSDVQSAPAGSGLQAGDVIIDPPEGSEQDTVIVMRTPEVVVLSVTPERQSADSPGQMGVAISGPSVPTQFGLVAATVHGVEFTARLMHAMVTTLARMFIGQAEMQIAGPVGISMMSRQMGQQGLVTFLEFMALLSLNLGIINLLPIPALDGGRLLFIGAEAVRGRRIEPSREAVVHLVGFVLVIGLMAVLTVVEVARLTGFSGP